jgi:alkylation response protein AidB-like acyl-CoA dehydrogenase
MTATDDTADLHDELRAVARAFLDRLGPGQPLDWSAVADLGWAGLEVPESLAGGGAGFAELAVVLVELGRAAAAGPYLGGIVLGVGALALLEPGPDRDGLLSDVAAGRRVVAVAMAGGDTSVGGSPPFRLRRTGGRCTLEGAASFVPDAPDADRLLLWAADEASPGGLAVAVVDRGRPGLEVRARPVVDGTRQLGTVVADGVAVVQDGVWRFNGDPSAASAQLLDRTAVAVACDSLGVAERTLELTAAYAGTRHQFGRPIGSFQAVKHICADMLVSVTVARHLIAEAVARVGAGDPEAWVSASMAKSYATASAVEVAGAALQVHGGYGYTWDSGLHVYLKRALLNRSLFGSPAAHRRRLSRRYRGPSSPEPP